MPQRNLREETPSSSGAACLELAGIQCLFQGHFIWCGSYHHEGILKSQHGFPIHKTARTDSGSRNDILNVFFLFLPCNLTVSAQIGPRLQRMDSDVSLREAGGRTNGCLKRRKLKYRRCYYYRSSGNKRVEISKVTAVEMPLHLYHFK